MATLTKKVLLFIVEGQSDAAALENVMQQILRPCKIRFHVVGADVTTRKQPPGRTIKTAVNEVVRGFMEMYRLRQGDLLGVAHLMDTDGAFVPASAVVEDPMADGFKYTTTAISAKSRQAVIDRNTLKSQQMLFLAGMGKTYKGIPYKAYFCSRNLEHALHDITGDCTAAEKIRLADSFHERYCGNPADFVAFISTVPPAVPENAYKASWDYISAKGTLRSLERGCNLHILVQEFLADSTGEAK